MRSRTRVQVTQSWEKPRSRQADRVGSVGLVAMAVGWLLAMVLPTGPLLAEAVGDDPTTTFERWYVVLLADQPVGWSHTTEVSDPSAETITTSSQMEVTLRRGAVQLQLSVGSRFVETADGQPIEADSYQDMGGNRLERSMRFGPEGIELTTRMGGQEKHRVVPLTHITGEGVRWLTPASAYRYLREKRAHDAEWADYWTIDPSMGVEPVQVMLVAQGREEITLFGKVVLAEKWVASVSVLPGVETSQYLDLDGRLVKSSLVVMPGMSLTLVQTDESLAKSPVNPPALLASTLIRPSQPIPDARRRVQAEYELRLKPDVQAKTPSDTPPTPQPVVDPDKPHDEGVAGVLDIPSSGFQHISQIDPLDPGVVRIKVDLTQPVTSDFDQPTERDLMATTILDSRDPRVIGLVEQALAGQPDDLLPTLKAERLRGFVHRFIDTKDLSVGFATAGEVARTGQGDCTEHAVLLAAMLRAAAIPSRTVSGLIYVDRFLGESGVFGYHMWTQAWIEPSGGSPGHWMDLDATLDGQSFDAAHIALARGSMSDDSFVNDLVAMAPLIGRLQVEVITP